MKSMMGSKMKLTKSTFELNQNDSENSTFSEYYSKYIQLKGDDSKSINGAHSNDTCLVPTNEVSTRTQATTDQIEPEVNSNTNSVVTCNKLSTQKRADYLSWNDYFMNLALLSAQRSKDPSTQVGACIVDDSNKIVGIGYNGMPINCDDDLLPWGKSSNDPLENKYLYVCHAELNAILNKNAANLKGCALFVTLFPCNECAKVIIQSRIAKIYYISDKNSDKPSAIASKRLLKLAGIKFEQHIPKPITLSPDLL